MTLPPDIEPVLRNFGDQIGSAEALTRERIWLEDNYVDLSLTTLARVAAALSGDGLITKREAIGRLGRFGVPDRLADEIRRRRAGEQVPVSPGYRAERAQLTHQLVADGIRTLTGA
jgi:hypothetical protein